jgi:ectoine hydroxylase-related dioxygenase (phytanoyl-CoA dioxygenase family)
MSDKLEIKNSIYEEGFTIVEDVYSDEEIQRILSIIDSANTNNPTFLKTANLFAIRQLFKEIPELKVLLVNDKLKEIIRDLFGENFFIVKSIYFDKPEESNWFVSYHQDLTISVDKKIEIAGFGPWTTKYNQFAVQPPLEILKGIYTIRIHLDDTNEENGALKVVPGSHLKNIYRASTIDWTLETEKICEVLKGGLMIMKPLLLHGSNKTTNNSKRRVIHIEFSNQELPSEIQWAERQII